MNRKATILFSVALNAASLIGMMTATQAAAPTVQKIVQKMEPVIISAAYFQSNNLPSANAVKLERMVVTARRDLSDMKPEPLARETKTISAPTSL